MLTTFAHLLLPAGKLFLKLSTIVFFYANPAKFKISNHPEFGQILTLKFVGFGPIKFCTEKAT